MLDHDKDYFFGLFFTVASPEKLPSLTPSEEQVARSTPSVEQVPRSTPSMEQAARSTPLEEQEEMLVGPEILFVL